MNAHTVGATLLFVDNFGGTSFPVTVTKVGARVPAAFGCNQLRVVTAVAADGRLWWAGCDASGVDRHGKIPGAQKIRTAEEVGRACA